MITVQEYYENLLSDISLSASVGGSVIETEFLIYALDKLQEYGEINSYDLVEDGKDASGSWRIDAISIDNMSEASTGGLSIFISLFDDSKEPKNLIQTELDALIKKLKRFVEFSLEKDIYSFFEVGSGHFDAAQDIKTNWKLGEKNLRFYIISNRPASKRISFKEKYQVADSSAEIIVWDLNRFFQVELSGKEREDLEISLKETPIKALLASVSESMTSVLAVMPATILVDIYSKWGSRLLEQNVRSFLTTKVKVNKGIRETIKSTPEMFFAFNNGITTTAEAAEFEQKSDGMYITSLKNLQIVNGGQTTASLFSASFKDKLDISKIFVQMKLSIISSEKSNQIVPFISRYANSQNKVTEADLFSNHPFHIRFQEFSRRISPPPKQGTTISEKWFYERARGQYLNEQAYLNTSKRNTFQAGNPKSQVITKTLLAKYLNSFDFIPHTVSKGAEINFSSFAEKISAKWESSEAEINEGFFRNAISKAIIFKSLEVLVSKQKDSWYNGHRDKIVPYTIAFLTNAIKINGKELDFEQIWKRQGLQSQLENSLIEIAEKVNELLNDPSRPFGNVAEYAKREVFWNTVKQASEGYDIKKISSVLISKGESKKREIEDKENQKFTNKIQIEMKVKSINKQLWEKIKIYMIDTNQDSPDKSSLIQRAISNPISLTPFQCETLYNLVFDYESHYHE